MNRRTVFVLVILVFLQTMVASVAIAEEAYEVAWSRLLSDGGWPTAWSVVTDADGNAFICGETRGDLGGPNKGERDIFFAKYDLAGNLLWIRQFGTSGDDWSFSMAVDTAGNIFVSGNTTGSFSIPNAGLRDAFLAKFDSEGTMLWIRQLGTSDSDHSRGVAVDGAGNAFICGDTWGSLGGPNTGYQDAYIAKYDPAGNLLWIKQFGTDGTDISRSVAVDGVGDIVISGYTRGDIGGINVGGENDAFLVKYDSAGNLLWAEQLGTSESEVCKSIAVDGACNIFISGYTDGSLVGSNAGETGAFLAKYDSAGSLLWIRQLGTSFADRSRSVAVDDAGNAFISGEEFGNEDAFLAKYDSAGNFLWIRQLGTSDVESYSAAVTVDGFGNVFISGRTDDEPCDAFLVKFDAPGPYYYVDDDAPAGGDGLSWETAFNYLQDGLAAVSYGQELRVAEGTYTPDSTSINPTGSGDREATFQLKDAVAIKGGFAGYGAADPDDRNVELYETILSGDLDGNDHPCFVNSDENSYHVVTGTNTGEMTILDGLTITAGNADGPDYMEGQCGGGMYNYENGSPTVINCTFRGNQAANSGGGMYSRSVSNPTHPTLINCTFTGNYADESGGAIMFQVGDDEYPTVLTNCIFNGNSSKYMGGAINNLGAQLVLNNCTFVGNSAGYAGAIRVVEQGSQTVTNSIFWNNQPTAFAGDGDGRCDVTYSIVKHGFHDRTEGNIDADPLFVDLNGPDGIAGTMDDDLRLSADSPCIDAGDNSVVTATVDMDGTVRIVNNSVDMGAYEFHGPIYVDADAAGANNGSSWEDAYTSLPHALGIESSGYEIRVAQGTYLPNDGITTTGDERALTFQLRNGVSVKGGYAGFGEPDPDARDIEQYKTILSGDLSGDDGSDFVNNDENSYHILDASETNPTAVLDGFIIIGGNADGYYPNNYGAGMYMVDNSSPTVLNCIFRGNSAYSGGGMYIGESSTSKINNCIFSGNLASDYGGGIYSNEESDLTLTNCMFIGNQADDGGGMLNVGGDMSRQSLTNCTFYRNMASSNGGGIFNTQHSHSMLTNCILWRNGDDSGMGVSAQIYDYNNSGIPGTPDANYSCIQGWSGAWGGTGNIDDDPLFVDPNGTDGIAGTGDEDLRLSADSLCIDSGDNSVVTETGDLDGNQRIFNDFVDMGAYEFTGTHIIFVDDDAVGDPVQNGTAAYPFDLIYEATVIAKDGHKVVVMPGTYIEPEISIPEIPIAAAYIDKNIILTSADPTDPLIVNNTLLSGRVVFSGTEDSRCKLKGFKISNPLTGSIIGNGTHAEISNCIISGNGPCQATVINDCDGLITNCLITDNTTFAYCGIYPVVYGCNGVVRNCTIANNISGIGDWSGGSMALENCIIYNNGEGVDPQVGISGSGVLDVSYCDIQDGSQGIDSDGIVNWGLGNIDVDPGFVRWGQWDYDAMVLEEGNYHLQSNGWRLSEYEPGWTYDLVTSRCIDAGNPGSPLADELMSIPRDPGNEYGTNLRVNMGAYGGTSQASMAPYYWAILGDLTNDGVVDSLDLAAQAEDWLTNENQQPGDLNRDGIVNIADFALLAKDWIWLTDWAK